MEVLSLRTHNGLPVDIDVCWPCHLTWFDHLESSTLSPGSVIDLFKRIHAERDTSRNPVGMQLACPTCSGKLAGTSDIARGGRFSYYRCDKGHGRLIAFTQFLREKNFIRSLQAHEISALAVTIKQVRCSSCGAPVNIEADSVCTHCGSPVSVLDEAAVEKALVSLQEKEVQRTTWDSARMNQILTTPDPNRTSPRAPAPAGNSQDSWLTGVVAGGAIADLVEIGIGAVLSAWLD